MARILVVGGSLGGLFVANMLLQDGHDVLVLEKVRGSMNGRGAGIVTHDALLVALGRAGLSRDISLGVAVQRRVLMDSQGHTVEALEMPQVLTSWSRLYLLLQSVLPSDRYLQGVKVTRIQESEDGVQVEGSEEGKPKTWTADLVMACDGIRSNLRQQLFPGVDAEYAGYIAWRGVCDESLLSQFTLETLFEHFGFCVPPAEQIIGYPVAGADNSTMVGSRAYNFVWYRPAAAGPELQDIMSDADGTHYPDGIPPHKISWRQVARMREASRQLLPPQFAEIVEKTALPFVQPIYDLTSQQLCTSRVALLGDAAFVARPHIGMGVTKAAEDALAMADAIAQHGANARALKQYEAQRQPIGLSAVNRARWLGKYVKTRSDDPDSGINRERRYQALHETGIDLARYGHLSAFKDE